MKINSNQTGWVVAGVMGLGFAFLAGSGFQDSSTKIGTVSVGRVFNDSEYKKDQDAQLQQIGQSRRALFDFIDTYKFMSLADLTKFKDLSVKANPTDADKAEINRLKDVATKADQQYRLLQTKANASEAEKSVLNNFIKNSQDNASFVGKLNQEFTDELQQKQEKMRSDILDRVKAAVAEVSKKQGFSIVLNDEIAPYSANDLTPEALKAMNAKK